MSATSKRGDGDIRSAEVEILSEATAIRRTESGVVFPAPAPLPREARAFIADNEVEVEFSEESAVLGRVTPSVAKSFPSLPPPVARFGKYDVVGRVAVGGMAEIFLARETLPGGALRKSALKVIKRQPSTDAESRYFEELFLREGRTVVQLAHPHICHVYDIGKLGEHLFIAMEWIDGRSLRDVLVRLSENGELIPPALAVGIAAQVASALEHAHTARDARGKRLNVVHRDVNPQNIMLRYDGSVKLVDFGVAHVSAEVDSRANTVKGKPSYMAPEQLLNKDVDGRADVFALGVCLYEMLSGLRLHKRASMRETLAAVLKEPAPSLLQLLPDLPVALDAIVQRALAKKPQDRFAGAGELQAALEDFLAERGEIGSARSVGSLMTRLYPNAQGGASIDSSAEATQHLSAYVVSGAMLWQRIFAQPRWLRWSAAAFFVALALVVFWLGNSPAQITPHAAAAAVSHQPASAAQPAVPALSPTAPAPVPAAAEAPRAPVHEAQPEPPKPKRRRSSPGFVGDPGF